MHITRQDIPACIDAPGATARQAPKFGDVSGFGEMSAEWFSLAAGTDIAPLLQGLPDDACSAPHWGYVLSGRLVVSYTDGSTETCAEQDLFYWKPGHSVRVEQDAEVVLFSPSIEHRAVLDHMSRAMAGAGA